MTDVHSGDYEGSRKQQHQQQQHQTKQMMMSPPHPHHVKKERKQPQQQQQQQQQQQPLPPLVGNVNGSMANNENIQTMGEYNNADFEDFDGGNGNGGGGSHPHQHILENSAEMRQKLLFQVQIESLTAQTERLRVLLREREIETTKLKGENSVLKQRERRSQKDLENLEIETQEAPALIRRIKDELTAAKTKIKIYYAQIGDDSRIIRQMHEERTKFKEQITRLEGLVSSKELGDRDVLNQQLTEANQKISDLQKVFGESEKKLEMVDRNLNADNKYLRAKIHGMEKEKELVVDQIKLLEENIKEKEKIIASLSIYRYNAIHRKIDATCKVCAKREKDEKETLKQIAIKENLPTILISSINVVSATGVEFKLAYGPHEEGKQFQFSNLRILYSEDPFMQVDVQKKKLDCISFLKASDKVFHIDGLLSGKKYYFSAVAGHQEIFGVASEPIEQLVDLLPESPTIITTMVVHDPPSIQIIFKAPTTNQGSKIQKYRVYQSSSPDFEERYLVIELPEELADSEGGNCTANFSDPTTGVPYYFKISAVNNRGEGTLSEASTETIIDYAPERPAKPTVKKMSTRSIHLSTCAVVGRGTSPSRFKITLVKASKTAGTTESHYTVPAAINIHGKREMHYTLEDVERGATYKVSVSACNATGESEPSDWSEEIDIDCLVPALAEFDVSITSSTSFTAACPSIKDIKNPTIIGYKIQWSDTQDMTVILGKTEVIPIDGHTKLISGLEEGQMYYVTAQLVGEREEGMPCGPIFLPLASAIPLPPSPVPMTASQELVAAANPPDLTKQSSSSSSSLRLSVNERVSNMHYGYAAYHAPPGIPVKHTKISAKRSTGSLDNLIRKSQASKPPIAAQAQTNPGASLNPPLTKSNTKRGSDMNLSKSKNSFRSGSFGTLSKA